MLERNSRIGFIGVGTIGLPMAEQIQKAGHGLVVHDIDESAATDLVADGARFAKSPREVADSCRLVFLSLPGPPQVETVVCGDHGILAAADFGASGGIIIDLSTNAHDMSQKLAAAAAKQGVGFLDAPVSGGALGARKGTLAVMVGGDAEALAAATPAMTAFASNIFHVGDSGMGTIAKLVNNQIFLTCAVSLQEGFVMAAKAGLDATTLLRIINKSSGGTYTGMAPMLLSRNFDSTLFQLAIAKKDLAVALQSAKALNVAMPTTEAALGVYNAAIREGLGDKVFFATQQLLEAQAGVTTERPERPEREEKK